MLPLQPSAGLRFMRSLCASERDEVVHSLSLSGAHLRAWSSPPGAERTYAVCDGSPRDLVRTVPDAAVDTPPLLAFEIAVNERHAAALLDALAGGARPAGAIDVVRSDAGVVVVWDEDRTALQLLIDLIDIETAKDRRIVPLFPLSDATIVRFVGSRLAIPDLGEQRLIETHLRAWRAAHGESRC